MPSISKYDVQGLPRGSNVYIYNIHPGVNSRDLYEKFSHYGPIVSCKIVRNKTTGLSMCRGYVQYDCKENADQAITNEDGKYFFGSCIRLNSFMSKEERISSITPKKTPAGVLNVRGINPDISEAELKNLFDLFGTIHSVYFTLDSNHNGEEGIRPSNPHAKKNGLLKGYGSGWGFVNYYDVLSAKIAKSSLNDVYFYGSKLFVTERTGQKALENEKGPEVTQFPVVIRTFDRTIDLNTDAELILGEIFPELENYGGCIQIYPHVEGTALQCVSVIMDDAKKAKKLVELVNSPENPWETLVACLAGNDAIKRRRRNLDEKSKEYSNEGKKFENKVSTRIYNTSPTEPSSFRNGNDYDSIRSPRGRFRGKNFNETMGGNHQYYKSKFYWEGKRSEGDKKSDGRRDNNCGINKDENLRKIKGIEEAIKPNTVDVGKDEEKVNETMVRNRQIETRQFTPTGLNFFTGWPMNGSMYQQCPMYGAYGYPVFGQAQYTKIREGMMNMTPFAEIRRDCNMTSMGIPLATPDQVKSAAGLNQKALKMRKGHIEERYQATYKEGNE